MSRIEGIMEDYGEDSGTCGYCHSKQRTAHRYCAHAHQLTTQAYKDLVDRGWRRSGMFMYQPYPRTSCCAQYAIRLELSKFKPSHGQQHSLNRFKRYIAGEWEPSGDADRDAMDDSTPVPTQCDAIEKAHALVTGVVSDTVKRIFPDLTLPPVKVATVPSPSAAHGSKDAVLTSSIALAINSALVKSGAAPQSASQIADAITSSLPSLLPTSIEAKASPSGHINFISASLRKDYDEFLSLKAGQEKSSREKLNRTGKPHEFTFTHKRAELTQEAFELYKKYQAAVHNEPDSTREGYKRFLVDSPFPTSKSDPFGIFHQEYRIDGRLVAVGVVDLIPSYFSSVYVFYDPDFRFLNLGVVAAMKEIEWSREHARELGLTHYVLGLYVPTCPKMLYKASYRPAELLCGDSFKWVPIEEAEEVISKKRPPPFPRIANEMYEQRRN